MALRYIEAITIRQPIATLVACGLTRFVPRHWGPKRGGRLLAIHAGRTLCQQAIDLCQSHPIAGLLARCGYEFPGQLPLGKVLAVGVMSWPHLVEVISHSKMTSTERDIFEGAAKIADVDQQPTWAWELSQVKRIKEPVPTGGLPGVWQWDAPEDLLRRMGFIDMAEVRQRDPSAWIDV